MERPKMSTFTLKCGLIGITAVVLTIISDFILIGNPISSYSFFKLGTKSMNGLPQWRILVGTFLGVGILPFQTAGLVPVYYGLKPGGKIKSAIVITIACHALIIAASFHISYAFIASGWRLYFKSSVIDTSILEMLKDFDIYWKIIITMIALDLILISILFTSIIIKKSTLYPKWAILLNPFFILIYTYFIVRPLPSPIGGFIAPAFLNISTLIFFTFSTFTICTK